MCPASTAIVLGSLIFVPGGEHCQNQEVQFTPASFSPYKVGPMTGRPVIADMNADGQADIVVACGTCCGSPASPESGHVAILLGDGKGGFASAAPKRVVIGPSARKIAVGDVNTDGRMDVVVAEHDTYKVTILGGRDDGTLSPMLGSPFLASAGQRPHTHEIALVDVNSDDRPDVITTNANDNNISVLLNQSSGGFVPAKGSPFECGRHPYDMIAAGDVNGDGHIDLVVPLLAASKISVLLGDGKGAFIQGAKCAVNERPGYLALGDLNGDKRPDLVVTHDDSADAIVMLNDGQGGFAPAKVGDQSVAPIRMPAYLWSVQIADMNNDKRADLVFGTMGGSKAIIVLGHGNGRFNQEPIVVETGGKASGYVVVGDLTSDGRADLVAGNYNSGDVSVLLARTAATRTAAVSE